MKNCHRVGNAKHSLRIVRSLKMRVRMLFLEVVLKRLISYFSGAELLIWGSSVLLLILAHLFFGGELISILGVTALIFIAKGNPLGQILMIAFSIYYSIVSCRFGYYGELMTYAGMTLPMAAFALSSWLKNPYNGNRAEVTVHRITKNELLLCFSLALAVTVIFYFVLRFFNTANLIPSTFSVTTSFIAVFLTFKRSPFFAIAYAVNDVVLIILWLLAARTDSSYYGIVICFVTFLINDCYSFFNWLRMEKKQARSPVANLENSRRT